MEEKVNLIWKTLTDMGLTINGYTNSEGEDEYILEADDDNLACLASYLMKDDYDGMCQMASLLKEVKGLWGHQSWVLARVGLTLGIIDRAEARAIARSWACDDAPDNRVLPGFLLYGE